MKRLIVIFCFTIISCGGDGKREKESHSHVSETEEPVKSLSPHTSEMAMIGDAHIHIDYSSPSVRDRIIFGGLVGYDRVWQAGAHNATWIETDKDLLIDGKVLPEGKYGFFVIPGKESWKVIFNKNWEQHGKDDYNEAEDVLTMTVEPKKLENIQETLVYKIDNIQNKKGVISLAWEKSQIEIPFEVKQK